MYVGVGGSWGLNWKPHLHMPGKCFTTERAPGLSCFKFFIKVYLSLENISNSKEKRKCVYVFKSDADQLTERLPGPSLYLQSLPTRLLSVPPAPISRSVYFGFPEIRCQVTRLSMTFCSFPFLILCVPGSKEHDQVVHFSVGRF